jgi:hypothetical protein
MSDGEKQASTQDGPPEEDREPSAEQAPEAKKRAAEKIEVDEPRKAEEKPHDRPAWVHALVVFDAWWTKQEARLCAIVVMAEIIALCVWIALKALSTEYDGQNLLGVVFRGVLGATGLGLGAHFATKKAMKNNAPVVAVAVIGGFVLARFWANAGTEYFSNVLNWLQSASTVTLVGGLRSPGLVTRLTLWVALLGASIATAQGKHINVDIVMRFLTPKLRLPVAVLGWLVAAAVCGAGVFGFLDTIAIEGFKARTSIPCPHDASKDCPTTAKERIGSVVKGMRTDLFLLGRQMSLDMKTLPIVLSGKKYNEYLKASEWNAWMRGADWKAHFAAEEVDGQIMDESQPDATRLPIINVPGSGEDTNGLLIRDLNLVFPFGLLMIALRFVLRSLLAIGGAVRVDPDVAHGSGGEAHEGAKEEDERGAPSQPILTEKEAKS